MAWLEKHADRPFFLFLHYYDAHFPYAPPPPFPSTYDGELAYVDGWIGKVMNKLRALGLYDNTLVIVAGDHGEGLGEHGEREHGYFIYQSTLHVPLIVRVPQGSVRGGRVNEAVSLVDIVPTVSVWSACPYRGRFRGWTLAAVWREHAGRMGATGVQRVAVARTRRLHAAVRHSGRRLEVHSVSQAGTLRPEPGWRRERQPGGQGAPDRALLAAAWSSGERRWLPRQIRKAARVRRTADTLRQLESLGYVSDRMVRGQTGSDVRQDDPKDFVAIFERCKAAAVSDEEAPLSGGEKVLLDIVAIHPRFVLARSWLAVAYYNLGVAADSRGQLNEAAAEYKKAIEIAPSYAAAEQPRQHLPPGGRP